MNRYLAIRDDIKAKLEAIDGIGVVHGRSRLAVNWGTYIARFKDDASGRIKGVEITRNKATGHRSGAYFRHHGFVLRAFLGFSDEDATDEIFQPLVDEICAAFRDAGPGVAWKWGDGDNPENDPAQVPVIDERMFGNVLCHYAEIHLSVTERINP